jgi:DNA segregation ATPase FtsK/SpoIIIE-like protein
MQVEAPGDEDAESNDPLYGQAVAIVVKTPRAPVSLVQRHLRIAYHRAARLIEHMEHDHVAQCGVSKFRPPHGQRTSRRALVSFTLGPTH